MKITTRGRYGLRAMLGLARCYGQGPVLAETLAQSEAVSRKYLHALLASLKKGGLVRSVRGAGGGFELTRLPADIHLDEVLRAAEGPLCLVQCVVKPERCGRSAGCTARQFWQKLSGEIENMLKGVSLQDLLALEQEGISRASSKPRRSSAKSKTV